MKLNDEYKSYGAESNKAIAENLEIPAIEYYTPKEVVSLPLEVSVYPEDSSSSNIDANASVNTTQTNSDNFQDTKDQLDKYNDSRNTADGVKSPDINASDSLVESGAASETAGAAEATATTVTSTVASLAGSVSVIAAAAAVMATVAGGVLEREPEIKSEYYEVGTNYIKYEIDVDSLSDDIEYIIRVSNPTYSKDFKIESSGMQRQIVTGLKPFRNYDVEIIGISKELGEIPYYKHECSTNQLPMPKAVFQFEPHFDYILGKIDLDYEAFISDFYNAGGNEYLQIYVGSKLLVDNHELPEDHFFKGTIRNINQLNDITAVAYSDYDDGREIHEGIEIGRFGYDITLPEDFSFETDYKAIYTFDDSCFYNDFNFDTGNILTVTTNFTNEEDPDELYRIDVYNAGDLDLNPNSLPLASITSNTKEVDLNLDAYVKYVDVKFTQLKRKGDDLIEYESSLIKTVEIDPKIMETDEFRFNSFGYYYEMHITDDYHGYGDIEVGITKNYNDGTSQRDTQFGDGYVSIEGSYDDNKNSNDVESFDLEIKYNNTTIENTRIYNNVSLKLSQFDVDDDGNIIIPYEILLPENATIESIWASINYADMDNDYDTKIGQFVLRSINSNIISGVCSVDYRINGRLITKEIDVDEYDLGAEVTVSYYAAHYNSYYDTINLKFETLLDGKNVNVNPDIYVIGDNGDEVPFADRYVPVYEFNEFHGYQIANTLYDQELDGYVFKYRLNANGFDNNIKTVGVLNSSAEYYIDGFKNVTAGYVLDNKPYVDYLKTTNADGTVNYYFDTKFVEESSNHYGRIEYSYEEDGKTIFKYLDFSADRYIELDNLKDLNYKFYYDLYYYDSINDIYYDIYPRAITDSGAKEYSQIYCYECREVKNSNVLNLSSATIAKNLSRVNSEFIDFSLNLKDLVTNEEISVLYDDNKYIIPFKTKDDEGVILNQDGEGYLYTNMNPEDDPSELPYVYYIAVSNDTVFVELMINNVSSTSPDTAIVSFTGAPNEFVDNYNQNVVEMFDASKLSSTEKVTIGTFSGTYDLSNLVVQDYGNSESGYELLVKGIVFNSTDSRDRLRIDVVYKGTVVASKYIYPGNDPDSFKYIDVAAAYTDVELKFVEVKYQEISTIIMEIPDVYEIEVGEAEIVEKYSVDPVKVIDSLSVNIINEATVNIDVTSNDFSNYKIKVEYEAKQFETSNYTKWTVEGNIGDTNVQFDYMSGVRNVKAIIYNDDNPISIFDIVFDCNTSDYNYNDGDDSISIPYELIIPENVKLTPNSSLNDENITSIFGNYVITELDSSNVSLNFFIEYQLDGTLVSYSFTKAVTLEGEIEIDGNINLFSGNSSYGSYSDYPDKVYLDESTGIAYYNNNGDYYDKNGNLMPEGDMIYANSSNDVYTYSGTLIQKIGCFMVPYEKEYVISVHTAGGNILRSDGTAITGVYELNGNSPDVKLDEYTISSSDVSGIYLTFLHEIVSQYYDSNKDLILSQLHCELSFDILVDGKVIDSKIIEFTTPSIDKKIDENAFNYNEDNFEIDKNIDGTLDLVIDTGFDYESYSNYVYKLKLYENTHEEDYYKTLVYESDYLTSNQVEIKNVIDSRICVSVEAYYVSGDNYILDKAFNNIAIINSSILSLEFDYDNISNTILLDKNYINLDYLNGSMLMEFTNNSGVKGTIDLSDSGLQSVGLTNVYVTDNNDGTISIKLQASSAINVRGTLSISQGNQELGYTLVVYTV